MATIKLAWPGRNRRWAPSFSGAVCLLFLVRMAGAMYSNIDDCDGGRSSLSLKNDFLF